VVTVGFDIDKNRFLRIYTTLLLILYKFADIEEMRKFSKNFFKDKLSRSYGTSCVTLSLTLLNLVVK